MRAGRAMELNPMYSRHSLSLLAAAVALSLSFGAQAQDATDLDEIVVTGTRTDVALQDLSLIHI